MELKTPSDVTAFVNTAAPKTRVVYHVGYLPKDRDDSLWAVKPEAEILHNTAEALHGYARAGRLQLVQRKLGLFRYEYIAIQAMQDQRASNKLAA